MKNKKLKILFDANPMVSGQKSGVGYYTFQLIEALSKTYPDDIELVGHYFNFLNRKNPVLPQSKNIQYKTSSLLPGKTLAILRRFGLQLPFDVLVKARGDVALFPNYVSLPTIQRIKKVIVIHDLCFEDFPQYLQAPNRDFLKKFVPISIKKADAVITISESTKRSILKHYDVSPGLISLTPIPPAKPQKTKIHKPKGLTVSGKYVLFMSTLEPRKNFISLVRAYCLLPVSVKSEFGLVLAGGTGWNVEDDMEEIASLQEKGENIVVTGYVSDDARTYLYQNASLFVMPSHYEGFGMPILEAMSYSLITAVSDIPVFHEVAGEATVYFNPSDLNDISIKMAKCLTDKKLQQNLRGKMPGHLNKYNWDDVATQLVKRIKEI